MCTTRTLTHSFLFLCCLAFPAVAQTELELARIVHPEVAADLGLDDTQRATIQSLLQERTAAIAASPEQRTELSQQYSEKILAVLSPEQREKFQQGDVATKLMFNFREQKWDAVLDWFAKQDDLSLVMDKIPAGTFTYSDTRSYTPAQGIDLLNSVLLTRGFTLIRQARMLIVIELSDTIPLEFFPRVTLEQLPSRGRFEMVSVEFRTDGRPMDQVLQAVEPYLGQFGRAIPLAGSGRLLVVETAGKMETINVLIASVPVPKPPPQPQPPEKPPQPTFATYSLGELDPQAALTTIKSLVNSEQITVDERTHLLSAYVVPGQQTAIKSFIDQMLAAKQELPGRQLEVYRWTQGGGEAVTEQIKGALPDVTVQFDEATQALFVTGTVEEQQQISQMLAKISGEPEVGDQQVHVYAVATSQVASVAELLQALLPSAQFVADEEQGRLVVRAGAAQHEQVREFVKQLEQMQTEVAPTVKRYPRPASLSESELAAFSGLVPEATITPTADGAALTVVGNAEAQTRVEKLLTEWQAVSAETPAAALKSIPVAAATRERFESLRESLATELQGIRFLESPRAGELLVWATEEQQNFLIQLLEQLAQAAGEPASRELRTYPVMTSDRSLLTELLQERFDDLRLVSGQDAEQLLIWAAAETHTQIEAFLQQIQAQLPTKAAPTVKSYQATGLDTTQLQTLLAPVIENAVVTVDEANQRLLIRTTAAGHEQISALIQELETPAPAAQQAVLVAYPLTHVDAASIETFLGRWLRADQWVVDSKSRQLVVVAPLEQHAKVKAMLQQIDQPAAEAAQPELRAYPIKQVDVSVLLTLLQPLWPDATFAPDPASSTLLVTATGVEHEEIKQVIQRLSDAQPGQQTRVETYNVPAGNLDTLPAILTQIAPAAVLSTDTVSRTLTVLGTDQDQQRIEQAISQLGLRAEERQRLELYPVDPARAANVLATATSLFPSAGLSLDDTGTQLVVLAAPGEQTRIKDLLGKMAVQEKAQAGLIMKVYRLEGGAAGALAELIQQTIPAADVVQVSPTGPAAVWATASQHERLASLLTEVTSEAESDKTSLKMYTLPAGQGTAFSTLLSQQRPTAQIALGAGTDKLVVSDTQQGHQTVGEIVAALKSAVEQVGQLELKSHDIRADLNATAQTTLSAAIPGLEFVAGTPQDKLLVWATAEQHDRIDQLVAQLQGELSPPAGRSIQVHPLQGVDRARAVAILQETIEGLEFLETSRPTDLTVWASGDKQIRVASLLEELKELQLSKPDHLVRVFPLDPEQVNAATLSEALTGQVPTAVTLQVNDATNSLLAYGPAADLERLSGLVETLKQELPPADRLLSEVYRLGNADPDAASDVLQALLPGRAIAVDRQTGQLAITGTAAEHTRVASFLEQYDRPVEDGERVAKVYRLADGDAQDLAVVLGQLVPQAFFTYRSNPPLVVAAASQADLQRVDEVVQQYQSQGEPSRKTQVFTLEMAEVDNLVTSIRAMSPTSDVAGDSTTNRLVVTASEEEMARIVQVIEQVDVADGGERETRVYRLEDGDSQDLATVLGQLVPKAYFTYRRSPPLVVAAGSAEDLLKVDAVVEQYEGPGGEAMRTEVFSLQIAEAAELEDAVKSISPRAEVASDQSTNSLLVTATEEELSKIKEVIQQVEQGGGVERVTQVYRLRSGDARDLAEVLMEMLPRALIVSDRYPPVIVATASPEDQLKIEQVVKQYQGIGGADQVTKVFTLVKAEANELEEAIQDLSPEALVTSDSSSNSLVVTADAAEMEKIEEVVKQVDQGSGEGLTTKVYSLTKGDPSALQEALEPLLPKAVMSGDPSTGGLFVTASDADHEQIAKIVADMEQSEGREPMLKAYAVRNANGEAVYEAVANAMPDSRTVGVSYDSQTSTIFVVGLAADQRRAQQIIEQIDHVRAADRTRRLKVFSLVGADGPAIEEAVQALFFDAQPEVVVQYDSIQEQLVVVGDDAQLTQVEETVKQFERPARAMEVFSLQENDPRAVQTAISQLFADAPIADTPAVSIDEGNAQIFVRATDEQLVKIKELLVKLGETIDASGKPAGRVRSLPASERLEEALEQVREVWPTLRPNRIQVLEITPPLDSRQPRERASDAVPKRDEPTPPMDQTSDGCYQEGEPALPTSSDPATASPPAAPGQEVGASPDDQTSPIVVIPGVNRWTIASDDIEALDQFEALLRSILRQSPTAARMGNFSVYLLKNAGAGQIEGLLNDLFRRVGQTGLSTLGRVAIVADERINALVVHGSRSERNTIEELLRVLDSDELMETLQSSTPQIIRIAHSPVSRIVNILETVYRSQLTSGGGRKQVSIPEGVSPEVASVLRQINAASSGPLLTLSADETTNSVVVRAPIELADEIREFIDRLDQDASDSSAQRINIIRLEGTNSARMRAAIDLLLEGQ